MGISVFKNFLTDLIQVFEKNRKTVVRIAVIETLTSVLQQVDFSEKDEGNLKYSEAKGKLLSDV